MKQGSEVVTHRIVHDPCTRWRNGYPLVQSKRFHTDFMLGKNNFIIKQKVYPFLFKKEIKNKRNPAVNTSTNLSKRCMYINYLCGAQNSLKAENILKKEKNNINFIKIQKNNFLREISTYDEFLARGGTPDASTKKFFKKYSRFIEHQGLLQRQVLQKNERIKVHNNRIRDQIRNKEERKLANIRANAPKVFKRMGLAAKISTLLLSDTGIAITRVIVECAIAGDWSGLSFISNYVKRSLLVYTAVHIPAVALVGLLPSNQGHFGFTWIALKNLCLYNRFSMERKAPYYWFDTSNDVNNKKPRWLEENFNSKAGMDQYYLKVYGETADGFLSKRNLKLFNKKYETAFTDLSVFSDAYKVAIRNYDRATCMGKSDPGPGNYYRYKDHIESIDYSLLNRIRALPKGRYRGNGLRSVQRQIDTLNKKNKKSKKILKILKINQKMKKILRQFDIDKAQAEGRSRFTRGCLRKQRRKEAFKGLTVLTSIMGLSFISWVSNIPSDTKKSILRTPIKDNKITLNHNTTLIVSSHDHPFVNNVVSLFKYKVFYFKNQTFISNQPANRCTPQWVKNHVNFMAAYHKDKLAEQGEKAKIEADRKQAAKLANEKRVQAARKK